MPTGYTAGIESGEITDLKQFALVCARAFGYLIELRDEPLNKPLPEKLGHSNYYTQQIESDKKTIEELEGLSANDWQIRYYSMIEKQTNLHKKYLAELRDNKSKYESIKSQVLDWTPPTDEHNGLKDFMLEQIEMCVSDYEPPPPVFKDIDTWKAETILSATKSLERSKKRFFEEEEKTKNKNDWLHALRLSLDGIAP